MDYNSAKEFARTLETDRAMEPADGTITIESMPLTDEDRERLQTIMREGVTADEMVQQLVTRHRRAAGVRSLQV